MKQSLLATKTKREAPAEETSKNAELLLRAGFVHKEMAGVYAFLPLGLRVFNKIVGVIREEMNKVGGQELSMTALQDLSVWAKTGRESEDVVDVWFKTKLKNDTQVGLGFTHEEPITHLMQSFVSSYRDLPKLVYQFQTKFRNETRAKSGIMRTREFVMKDLYSFARSNEAHAEIYENLKAAYVRIFERLGIGETTFVTFASGGTFSKYSHEFQTITDAGEDIVYVDTEKNIAINEEVFTEEVCKDLGVDMNKVVKHKTAEVGNIFSLGTRFSEAFDLYFDDEDGSRKPVVMGSYGIGPARVMGVIVESFSDEKGIVWPKEVAPYLVHVLSLGQNDAAEKLVSTLEAKGIEVLYDDRDERPGVKFQDADLIGIPYRVVVSEKTLAQGGYEIKKRTGTDAHIITEEALVSLLSN